MSKQRLVIIGNGMAGARFVEELLAQGGGALFEIAIFGDEPYGNYNRILLSNVLAGTYDAQDIFINPPDWYRENGVRLHLGVRALEIDRQAKRVIGEGGCAEAYDKLVIATGSRPVIPPIEGLSKDGVFVFRTLDDCRRIAKEAKHAQRAAIIGGGLLGLEAAYGLLKLGLETHVVHLMSHLMEAQLDATGGAILKRELERMGLKIHLRKRTIATLGQDRVTGLVFDDGATLDCDMVIVCAGTRPNVELAQEAGLAVERGIVIGDDLASPDDPDIYAIGECAEHNGQTYGTVAPLWDQARILAERLARRNPAARYTGSRVSTRLKVAGIELTVMGAKDPQRPDDEVVVYSDPSRAIYKKLIIRNGRLIGAILLGDGMTIPTLLQAFDRRARLPENPAEIMFSFAWSNIPKASETQRICHCNGVSRAKIVAAIRSGHCTVDAVAKATRAGTGCGSCRTEIHAILEAHLRETGGALAAAERVGQLRAAYDAAS